MKTYKDETVRIGAKAMNDPATVVTRAYDALMPKFSTDGKFHPAGLDMLTKSFIELKTFDHADRYERALHGEVPTDRVGLSRERSLPELLVGEGLSRA